jgi:predicted metal-binding membrane protein
MFGLGVGNVGWMGGLAGVMLVEKSVHRRHCAAPLVGAVLVTWGALVLAHPTWLPAVSTGAV